MSFDGNARLLVAPTTDRAQLTDAIRSLSVGAGTATAAGIRESLAAIEAVPETDERRARPGSDRAHERRHPHDR